MLFSFLLFRTHLYIYEGHGELVEESCANFEAGAFICGSLENLGWAVFRGIDFVGADKAIDMLDRCPARWWEPIKDDKGRKMLGTSVQDNSQRKQKVLEPFVTVKDELFKLCTNSILKVNNYRTTSWTIMINDGESDGQGLHTDFAMVHDTDHVKHSSTGDRARKRAKGT